MQLSLTSSYGSGIQDFETKKPRVKIYVDKESGRQKEDALVTFSKVLLEFVSLKFATFLAMDLMFFFAVHSGAFSRFGNPNFGWYTFLGWWQNSYICYKS